MDAKSSPSALCHREARPHAGHGDCGKAIPPSLPPRSTACPRRPGCCSRPSAGPFDCVPSMSSCPHCAPWRNSAAGAAYGACKRTLPMAGWLKRSGQAACMPCMIAAASKHSRWLPCRLFRSTFYAWQCMHAPDALARARHASCPCTAAPSTCMCSCAHGTGIYLPRVRSCRAACKRASCAWLCGMIMHAWGDWGITAPR